MLAVALGTSIAAHVIFALVARPFHTVEAHEDKAYPTTITIRPKRTPPATPPPTPQPPKHQSAPHKSATVHPAVKLPSLANPAKIGNAPAVALATPGPDGSGDGTGISTAPAATTPAPAPIGTPKPQCSVPYESAHAVETVTPVAPESAAGVDATVQVQVTLSSSGSVLEAGIYKSAGNFELDRAAVAAARESRYAPEIRDCRPVGGTYLFTASFTQQ